MLSDKAASIPQNSTMYSQKPELFAAFNQRWNMVSTEQEPMYTLLQRIFQKDVEK